MQSCNSFTIQVWGKEKQFGPLDAYQSTTSGTWENHNFSKKGGAGAIFDRANLLITDHMTMAMP